MSLALDADHRKIALNILSAHLPPGFAVRVFGSRAKGAPKRYSDLDLALKGLRPLTLAELAELAEAFSESDLPFKVDVVDWRSLGPVMQAAVDRDGIELRAD